MDGSAPRDVGRPSKMVSYAPQVAEWLREDPTLSGAKILQRIRRAGYRGGKSALYEFVRRLRVPGSGYRRCPGCRALLRDSTGTCPHCGRSEEHTSELQSHSDLVCRLLLEKKKKTKKNQRTEISNNTVCENKTSYTG